MTTRLTKGTTPTTGGGSFSDDGIAFVKVESISAEGRIDYSRLAYIDSATNARLSRSQLERDDILFTIAGTIGRVAQVTDALLPANTNQAVAIIRPNRELVEPRFLYFALRDTSRIRRAQARVVQSVQANFSLGELSRLEISLPSLHEQRAIASILGALDEKIENDHAMNDTMNAMAQALYKSWFVDFDQVRANRDGRRTDMPGPIARLFPRDMASTNRGEIPLGWGVATIRDLASSIEYGFTTSASKNAVGPRFLRITDIQGGKVDWERVPYCVASAQQRERYRIHAGDILVARTGASTGENIYVSAAPEAVFASYLVRFQFANTGLGRYVGSFMRTKAYFDYIAGSIGGSAQPNASAQALAGATLVVPNADILDIYGQTLAAFDARIFANQIGIGTLASLRDSLLPKLTSGDILLSDAEHVLDEMSG